MFEQFTAKMTAWGTNGMMVYPLESAKIVSKLSGLSTSLRGCAKESYPETFESNKLVYLANKLLLDASCYKI